MADTLHETDILAWCEREGGPLDRLRAGEPVNAAIDWTNLIEEVRDSGRSELHACHSLLRQALIRLLKLTLWPDSRDVPHWREETATFLDEAVRRFTPSMRQRISVASLHDSAVRALRARGDLPRATWPQSGPLTLDDLLRAPPEIDRLLSHLAGDRDRRSMPQAASQEPTG